MSEYRGLNIFYSRINTCIVNFVTNDDLQSLEDLTPLSPSTTHIHTYMHARMHKQRYKFCHYLAIFLELVVLDSGSFQEL